MVCERISAPFNRFYHGVVLKDAHQKALSGHLTINNMNSMKQGLKTVDENYPKKDGKPISTNKLSNKQLVWHIEFIIAFLGEYGITLDYIEKEWEILLKGIR